MTDSHINVVVEFSVPEDVEDISHHLDSLCRETMAGTKDCIYYGFARCGEKYLAREGYRSATGFITHLGKTEI